MRTGVAQRLERAVVAAASAATAEHWRDPWPAPVARVPARSVSGGSARTIDLRHTHATLLRKAGVDLGGRVAVAGDAPPLAGQRGLAIAGGWAPEFGRSGHVRTLGHL